ncbi:Glutathione S-transferase [Sesamum alatum]|uniref:glutathione transferase n=1 Tax=Sesamum alatum TaxID=300844 RepID=A0AAE2CIH0_9LAMI|nr:Glutathione S-transferase [Sesamum alatum]
MAIKVHGQPLSSSVQRVVLCLAEKGLEYELVLVDFATGQHKKEPFISINPFGQIPGFEDGDLTLFESRAITKYISHAYADKGTPLIAEDPKKQAIIGVWLEVEALKFDAAGQKLSSEILIKPMLGMTTDEAAVEQFEGELVKVLDVYEARLAKSKYLAGDDYSLADLHHVPIISNLFTTKVKAVFEERPHVSAWCADILARPAWQKVLQGIKF